MHSASKEMGAFVFVRYNYCMISKKAYLLNRYEYTRDVVRKVLKTQEIENAKQLRKDRLEFGAKVDTAQPKC